MKYPPPIKIEKGQVFRKLTAIKNNGKVGPNKYWIFKCECGTIKSMRITTIVSGMVDSCGCLRNKYFRDKYYKRK